MAENVNEALVLAAGDGSLRGVKAALKAGADIDFYEPDSDGTGPKPIPPCTALHLACIMGHVDVVRLLLRKGASVVKRDRASFAPLHSAVSKGWIKVVEVLLQHGATVDIRDGFQNTPLMAACSYNHVDIVRLPIEFGARPDVDDGYIAERLKVEAENRVFAEESLKLLEEARKSKLLRCCNPKCHKPDYRKNLKLCAGCKLTRYCSRDCQKQHWSVGHKKCCGHDVYSDEQADPFQKMTVQLTKQLLEQADQM
ncbi:poly [ADP-ribose] polymerase tankyrase-1-like isoform X1 [Branchiostoma floridae]|uniref:Poly [ADP-ribose] polymerase tankyrase-1-like isoform X1 n=2 Tax=Branchiostoma floridae TaxID=7739 RepID=A0A9J7LGU6_BRAFL|nr:poly [ADP-ribose] polymerase tankyrase-1-like isoform X1 [Branchiostoma floridae]XP_035681451.1 poly [ADP-ribose] polymerase tankyrase-1-like isoform X1 [Branchiostoma floridae]